MSWLHRLIHDGPDGWLESFALMVVYSVAGTAVLTAAVTLLGITLHLLV